MLGTINDHTSYIVILSCARLWQEALIAHDPVWVASGVCPLPGRQQGQTWKELVASSSKLRSAGIGGDVLMSPQAVCYKGLNLWNSGAEVCSQKSSCTICHYLSSYIIPLCLHQPFCQQLPTPPRASPRFLPFPSGQLCITCSRRPSKGVAASTARLSPVPH